MAAGLRTILWVSAVPPIFGRTDEEYEVASEKMINFDVEITMMISQKCDIYL